MKILDIPKSGRSGEFVFYMLKRWLCRRRLVIPTNVRTPARRRTRTAFGAISKAWSQRLTEAQRRAWMAAAAKVPSRPRLGQSGPLTGEMHFVGRNAVLARVGRDMLLEPPAPVVFGPNPVKGLSISHGENGMRLELRLCAPVVEDIMVFGQAPCSAGRKKWRHGAYLGLLPSPRGGMTDITEMYLAKFGKPLPGKRVFIRLRQQTNGWQDNGFDLSEIVPAKAAVAPKPGTRNPCRRQNQNAGERRWQGRGISSGRFRRTLILFRGPAISVRCAMHKGVSPKQHRSNARATPGQRLPVRAVREAPCGPVRLVRPVRTRRNTPQRERWRGG